MPRRPTCSTSWLFLDASEILCRSIHRRCSVRKGIFRNFTEFRTPVPESLFFFMAQPATLLKKRLWHRCFPVSFAKFLRTTFLQSTSGRLVLCLLPLMESSIACLIYIVFVLFYLILFIYLFVLLLYVIYVFFIFIYIFIYFINLFIYLFF